MATDLARFAASLRANPSNRSFLDHVSFPMYTVPAEFLLQMKHLKTHEEMLQVGALVEFSTDLGRAMFVSHEWLSNRHPDPNAEQLQILQQALRNIASGSSNICVPVATEIMFGRLQLPRADSVGVDLYIWYDYFCCPQHSSNAASVHRQAAIDSIPTYVSQCYFFVILCPALKHVDQCRTLSQSSWALRGWCRCERVARELAAREDGYIIVIESAVHQTLVWLGNRMLEAPGEGDFTVEQDKVRVGRMMVRMIWDKLLYYLEKGDLHNYRFLSNSQRARFFRGLDVVPIESFIPPSGVQADAFREPDKFLLEWFLHQNGFRGVSDRDEKGWSPLCFAALNGDPLTIKSLLRYRADPNDMTAKARIKAGGEQLPRKSSVVAIAAFFRNNEAVEVLLSARASPNALDENFGNSLHFACAADNAVAVQLLISARANPQQKCLPGLNPFQVSCACVSLQSMKEILAQVPELSLRHSLHFALMFSGGGSPEIVTELIRARADVNEQFRIRLKEPGWWLLLNLTSIRHRVSPSRLTCLAYHHYGATPLMFSILSGYLQAASALLTAGAHVDSMNFRRKTALDLASQMLVPAWLMRSLDGRDQGPQCLEVEELTEEDVFFI
ncbi:ANKRD44 [Symbiodinium microadriaticum]|nr:ANKRD44 [Symbiodinium microadriaticum]CAE7881154.1 ANKRD44 [Symbiodinium sp. KB8]